MGHEIRMDEARITKILLYGRVDKGTARQGNHSTYINSVKSLWREYEIESSTLEELAKNRNAWWSAVYNMTNKDHENYNNDKKEWRQLKKAQEKISRVSTKICAGVFEMLAGSEQLLV